MYTMKQGIHIHRGSLYLLNIKYKEIFVLEVERFVLE